MCIDMRLLCLFGLALTAWTSNPAIAAPAATAPSVATQSANQSTTGRNTSIPVKLSATAAVTAPSITTQPAVQSVTVGSAATYSVVASGTAPFSYQWFNCDVAIAGATAATYTTPATKFSDRGARFTVVVSNAAGSQSSKPATLIVTPVAAGVDVTTYHNDVARTGQNLAEATLTPANVSATTFGLLRTMPVDGKIDAQPLVLSDLSGFAVGGTSVPHNAVYVATEHDSVYAFDADTGTLLWQVSLLGAGESSSDNLGCSQITPEIGVTATPVIDRAAGMIFVVAMSKDGSNYIHRLHALSLTTGAEAANSPVLIAASLTATGAPGTVGGQIIFNAIQYAERSALLLANGTIYTSWTSHCDVQPYTGWVIAYNEDTLARTAVFNDEPSANNGGNQGQASFWSAGSGPSADAAGNIYVMSANGSFDTTLTASGFPIGSDYGNAIIKLAPPSGNTLAVLDYFTMFNTVSESAADQDLASGGLMLLPDQIDSSGTTQHLAVGAGKDNNIYVVSRDSLGKFNPADNSNAYQFVANAFPGSGLAPCGGGTGVWGAPVYFNGVVFYDSTNDAIRAFPVTYAKFAAQSSMQTAAAFCYSSPPLSISANGTSNAILWAVENSTSQAVLHAFDATYLSIELYNSAQAGSRDQFGPGSKWTPPTIADGLVFVATQAVTPGAQNYLAVFGLL